MILLIPRILLARGKVQKYIMEFVVNNNPRAYYLKTNRIRCMYQKYELVLISLQLINYHFPPLKVARDIYVFLISVVQDTNFGI